MWMVGPPSAKHSCFVGSEERDCHGHFANDPLVEADFPFWAIPSGLQVRLSGDLALE
jgi:hypothetical protein